MDTDTSSYAWRKGAKHYGIRECRAIERAIERGIITLPGNRPPQWTYLEVAEYFGPSTYSPTAPGCRIRIPGLGPEFPTDLGDDA